MSIIQQDEITYPFPNFSGATIEVCEWMLILFHTLMDMQLVTHARIKVNLC